MCIIAAKPKGIKLPTEDTLKHMWNNNDDGAGYMYTNKGQVHIHKGFMTLKSLKKSLNELKIDTTNTPIVLHFRIGTSGGNVAKNTHPFPIVDKLPLLEKTSVKTRLAVAHNGVIDIKPSKKDISDTMEYVMTQLTPLYRLNPNFYKLDEGKKLVYNATQSKLAFLDSRGNIELVGKFIEANGIHYSNDSYLPKTKYYNWDMWDDYSTKWYSSLYGRYMTWLDEKDGYIVTPAGDILSIDYHLTDRNGNIYIYDWELDKAIEIEGTFYTHNGLQRNMYNALRADYMEIVK